MMRSLLRMLCGVCVLGVIEVAAQVPQGFQPPDQSQESERQTWLTYERALRAWCTQYYPASVDLCLQTEMAKYGVSPEFFAVLQGQSQDANDPCPLTPEATRVTVMAVAAWPNTSRTRGALWDERRQDG